MIAQLRHPVVLLLVFAQPAMAHGTLAGSNSFYAGMLHPVVALTHALGLLALGALMGRDATRIPLWGVAAGALGGTLSGIMLPQPPPWLADGAVLLALGACACMLALRRQPGQPMLAAGATVLGLGIGLGTELPNLPALGGLGVGMALMTLNSLALARVAQRWPVSLQIAGSWMLAIAILALAFHLAGPEGMAS